MQDWINKLKLVEVKKIEEAVARAVGDLVGDRYSANISNIEFEPVIGGSFKVKLEPYRLPKEDESTVGYNDKEREIISKVVAKSRPREKK
jgi:hypothetical protein